MKRTPFKKTKRRVAKAKRRVAREDAYLANLRPPGDGGHLLRG